MPKSESNGIKAMEEARGAVGAVCLALEQRFLQDWEAILSDLTRAAEQLTQAEAATGETTEGNEEFRAAAEAIHEQAGRLSLLMRQKAEFLREWQEEAGVCFEGYLQMGAPAGRSTLASARWEA